MHRCLSAITATLALSVPMVAVAADRTQSAEADSGPTVQEQRGQGHDSPGDLNAPGAHPQKREGATPVGKKLPGEKKPSASSSELPDACYFFYARSVGPCIQMIPTIKRLQREGFRIEKVDIGARIDLSKRYMIGAVPTLLIKKGPQVVKLAGLQDEQALRSALARYKIEKEEGREEPLVLITYPVGDLVTDRGPRDRLIPAGDLKSLASAIETAVEPDSWEDAFGDGKINPIESTLTLVIRQTPGVHRQIQAALQGFRRFDELEREAVELP
jgi:thiol-disulfide isomerase/thioredoxin